MMMMDIARDIARNVDWSPETYTVRELLDFCKKPVIALVRQGHCSLMEEDSLSQGQIIRIARIHVQNRIVARDAKNREISIPLAFPIPFEILKNKSGSLRGTFKKMKQMKVSELVRNYNLPQKVRLPSSYRNHPIVLSLIGVDLSTGPIDVERLDEEIYLQGNAVNFGELDTTVLSVPDHSDLEVSIALGAKEGKQSQFKKLENRLTDTVAKEVRFGDAISATAIKRMVQIGAELAPARPPPPSTLRGASAFDRSTDAQSNHHMNGDASSSSTSSLYKKREARGSRPSISVIEKRMKENNPALPPPIANGSNSFHFDNAAFDIHDAAADAEEAEPEEVDNDLPEPAVWTEIKLEGDDDRDIAPPKDLFTTVSAFSFHNPTTWGFGDKMNTKA